jgi:hypothetical protein
LIDGFSPKNTFNSASHTGSLPSFWRVDISNIEPQISLMSIFDERSVYNPKSIVNPVNSSFNPKYGTPNEQSVQYRDPILIRLIPNVAQGQAPSFGPTLLPKHERHPLISQSIHVSLHY